MRLLAFTIALLLSATGAIAGAVMVQCQAHVEIANRSSQTITEKKAVLEITFDAAEQRVLKFTSYLLPACTDPGVKTEDCRCKVTPDRIACEGRGTLVDRKPRQTQGNFTIDRMSGKISGMVKNQLSTGQEEFFFDGQCGKPGQSKF
jgi:hypothetical protein